LISRRTRATTRSGRRTPIMAGRDHRAPMVDPSATVTQAPVITMIIDSANADGPRALFELVEAATRTDPTLQ
jgi:hypothetical protein